MPQIRATGFHSASRDKSLSSEFLSSISVYNSFAFSEGDVITFSVTLLSEMKKKD